MISYISHSAEYIHVEEGRAASKSPHKKFGYFLSFPQQAVSADIIKKFSRC
jgi:hypothetical protein